MQPGHLLGGRFEIVGELGRGSMATVYLVKDQLRGTRVALKVLHEHLADDADARRRLTREVRTAARIQHPNALVASDIHDLDGRLALSMPVHRGLTLADAVDADGPMGAAELERLAQDLAGALAAAHNVGVIHRDVGPNNILVERGGPAMLADFGLARLEGHTTRSSVGAGTWGYAAPEVFQGASGDPRSDLYSLGASLYFAATGSAPFTGTHPAAIVQKQLSGDHVPLARLRPDLPAALVASIEGMLAVDPESRTQGAREAMDALVAGVAPSLPSAPATALEAGMYSVVLEKTAAERQAQRQRRRLRGPLSYWPAPIGPDEQTDAEKALARVVTGGAGATLPAALRRVEFRLVDAVSHDTAERLAKQAIELGFVPQIVHAPRKLYSERRAPLKFLIGAFLAVAAVALFIGGLEPGSTDAMVALSLFTGLVSMWLVGWGALQMRLPLAFARTFAGDAAAVPEHEDPLLRMHQRTDAKLQALSAALQAQHEVPEVLRSKMATTLASLRLRAATLVEPAQALHVDLAPDPDAAAALQRIHKRLQRMDTLASAGEPVDEAERQGLLQGLQAAQDDAALREEAEVLRTRIAARLLEIGAAATRATRTLRRDDLAGSLATLTQQLEAEATAAAEVIEELDALATGARLPSEAPAHRPQLRLAGRARERE